MKRNLGLIQTIIRRNFAKAKAEECKPPDGGVPGQNLPFGKSLGRPAKMTLLFILYFGTGFWVPNIAFMYMMLKCHRRNLKMIGRSALFARNAIRQFVRMDHGHGGIPGENLPFSINNRYKLTAMFIVFFGSGLGAPFLILRHQLVKQ